MRSLLVILLLLPSILRAECGSENFLNMLTEEEAATLAQAEAQIPYGEGLTWRATHPDGREITVVGTLHVPDPRHDAMLDKLRPILAQPDTTLLVETNAEDLAKASQIVFTEPDRVFISDGPTVADLLSPEEWAQVREAASASGIPAPFAAKMQPWFLALTLSLPACVIQEMAQGEPGLDHQIMAMADELGVETLSLEPWDTVFELFAGNSLEEQLDMLRTSTLGHELSEAAFVALRELYFSEETGQTWAIGPIVAARAMPQDVIDATFAEMENDLLLSRNAAWLERLSAMDTPRAVVAVGAAHLQGEGGVLKGLADLGWTLERF